MAQTVHNMKYLGKDYAIPEAFLEKYNIAGPRYTSYPTAPEWKADFGPEEYQSLTGPNNAATRALPLSLYFHIPFCRKLCLYCGCNVVITQKYENAENYIQLLIRELDLTASSINRDRQVLQIAWGGGTPTFLKLEEIRRLHEHAKSLFKIAPNAEISVEVDPRVTTREQLALFRELGFNRLSLGQQDFDAKVQKAVHRVQPYDMMRYFFKTCRDLGFHSINMDLIYGLPYQTVSGFRRTLDLALTLSPDRVALFNYAHVPWLRKHMGVFTEEMLPNTTDKFQIFMDSLRAFTEAGYLFIGLDHFAKPGDDLSLALKNKTLRRNFMGYTTCADTDLYAFGVSSISSFQDGFAQNFKDIPAYARKLEEGLLPVERGMKLDADDRLRQKLIERLMCHLEIDKAALENEFGIIFDEYFKTELQQLQPLMDDGLMQSDGRRLGVTPVGRIFIRNLAMVFDRYLRNKEPAQRRFSKTL